MKKSILLFVTFLFLILNIQAQENTEEDSGNKSQARFGLKAGFSSLSARVSSGGNSASSSTSGFYIGAFAEFYLSEQLDLQPELTYANYSENGESIDFLLVPILLKYDANEELSILAGPQIDYLLDSQAAEGTTRVGIDLGLGISYNISENVMIDARYTFGLSNRIDDPEFENTDIKGSFNFLQIGLAYKFN